MMVMPIKQQKEEGRETKRCSHCGLLNLYTTKSTCDKCGKPFDEVTETPSTTKGERMMFNVSITESGGGRWGEPETCRVINITHCLLVLRQILQIAEMVDEGPAGHGETAVIMAHLIVEVRKALNIPRQTEGE